MWLPRYMARSVAEIDFAFLYSQGYRTCLIDLDGTVVERGMYEVSDKTKQALCGQRLQVFIATNRPKKPRTQATGI